MVEDELIDSLQVGYDVAKKEVETPLLRLVREVIATIIIQRKMDSLLSRNVHIPTQYVRIIDALQQQVFGYHC